MGGYSRLVEPNTALAKYKCKESNCNGMLHTIYNQTLKPSGVIKCPNCEKKSMELVSKWN